MPKFTKVATKSSFKARKGLIVTIGVLLVVGSALPGIHAKVQADQYDDQVNALSAKNAQAQASVSALQAQADTYAGEIAALQAQIATLQAQIAASQAQEAALQAQIAANTAEIAKQKAYLASNVKAMYVAGTPSTIEVLANSKDLSDYVDKKENLSKVQTNLQDTVKKIASLQQQLAQQKVDVDNILKNQTDQENQLASDQAQQNQLLAYNESQQSQYTQQMAANNAQILAVRAAQKLAYERTFSGSSSPVNGTIVYRNLTSQQACGGGYPSVWCGTQDTMWDNWRLYNRECVSYVAWWEASHGHYVPTFGNYKGSAQGNANQWQGVLADSGAASIIPGSDVGSSSSVVGDAVYIPLGGVGHVAVVLSSAGDGWVHVGQYNIYEQGMYSEMDLKITSNLTFFQFH